MEAFQLLGCKRHDYFEGVQNVWYVTMPEFVKHVTIKPITKTTKTTELDDEYHTGKFRTTEPKKPVPQDN